MADVPLLSDLQKAEKGGLGVSQKDPDDVLERKRQRLDFLKFKAEQRGMIQKRDNITCKIESMKREFEFIDKLTPDDVCYIIDAKQQAAARVIQNQYRNLMHLRRKLKKKQNAEDIDVELEYYSKEMKQRLAEVK